MVPFKRIEAEDIPRILAFFSPESHRRIERSLLKYCGNGNSEISMTIVDNAFVMRQEIQDMYVYSMPKGKGNIRIICMEMMEDANSMGYDWMVVGVNENQKNIINGALPNHFKFISEEKYSYLDIVRLCKSVDNEPTIIAKPTVAYINSIFYNNEEMVPA